MHSSISLDLETRPVTLDIGVDHCFSYDKVIIHLKPECAHVFQPDFDGAFNDFWPSASFPLEMVLMRLPKPKPWLNSISMAVRALDHSHYLF